MNQVFETGQMIPNPKGDGSWRVLDGKWWREHSELRKRGKPDLDYTLPAARR